MRHCSVAEHIVVIIGVSVELVTITDVGSPLTVIFHLAPVFAVIILIGLSFIITLGDSILKTVYLGDDSISAGIDSATDLKRKIAADEISLVIALRDLEILKADVTAKNVAVLICGEAEDNALLKELDQLVDYFIRIKLTLIVILAPDELVRGIFSEHICELVDHILVILAIHKEHTNGIFLSFIAIQHLVDIVVVGSSEYLLANYICGSDESFLINAKLSRVCGNLGNLKLKDLKRGKIDIVKRSLSEVEIENLAHRKILEIVIKRLDLRKVKNVLVIAVNVLVREDHICNVGKDLFKISCVSLNEKIDHRENILLENVEHIPHSIKVHMFEI